MIVNFHYEFVAFFFSCLAESLLFDVELSWKIDSFTTLYGARNWT